jgi:hypothetical protein
MIRERTRAAMNVKRARGERISGHAPFGWDFGPKNRVLPAAVKKLVLRRPEAEPFRRVGVEVPAFAGSARASIARG